MPKNSIPYKRNLLHNSQTFIYYFNKFKLFATSIFKWHNLPASCDERVLENALFYYGNACLVADPKLGDLSLNCVPQGNLNMYGLPIRINAFGENGFSQFYNCSTNGEKDGEAIFILNNKNKVPTLWIAQYYAFKIANIQEAIDTNVNSQKTPFIVQANKKQELSIRNALNKVLTNEPYILVNDTFKQDNFKVFDVKAPFVADKLLEVRKDYESQFYTDLGINNININKKERLITDEADSNNEIININLMSFLDMRQKACEEFNKLKGYGENDKNRISVSFNASLINDLKKQGLSIDDNFDKILDNLVESKLNNILNDSIKGGD